MKNFDKKFKVVFADINTGIILDLENNYQLEGPESSCLYFKTYEDALSFSKKKIVLSPEIECIIMDNENVPLHTERNEAGFGVKKQNEDKVGTITKKKWWQFFQEKNKKKGKKGDG